MSDSTPITSEQAPELYLDIESADAIMTPKVEGDILDAFAEPPRPTTPDVYELREVFEADQEEAAQLEEALVTVEPAANEVSEKTEKPRFGSKLKVTKSKIDLLDTNTRLGRAVSIIIFGEKSPNTPKELPVSKNFNPSRALAKQIEANKLTRGALSPRALQKYRDDN